MLTWRCMCTHLTFHSFRCWFTIHFIKWRLATCVPMVGFIHSNGRAVESFYFRIINASETSAHTHIHTYRVLKNKSHVWQKNKTTKKTNRFRKLRLINSFEIFQRWKKETERNVGFDSSSQNKCELWKKVTFKLSVLNGRSSCLLIVCRLLYQRDQKKSQTNRKKNKAAYIVLHKKKTRTFIYSHSYLGRWIYADTYI